MSFYKEKNILIITFTQNEGEERYERPMIIDFTNTFNCWKQVALNVKLTQKQRFYRGTETLLISMWSSVTFHWVIEEKSWPRLCRLRKGRGTNRKWHHSFYSLTLGDKGMNLQKKRGKRERDRKWMGWMEGTKEWGDLEQSCPAGQITGNLLLTAESVASVSAGSSNHHELRIFTWTLTTATISILRTRNSVRTVD